MKRFLCPKHIHHLKTEGKTVLLDSKNCTICRWENRPNTLADLASFFEQAALDLRDGHEHPGYDPHGITIRDSTEFAIKEYLKSIHEDYRNNFMKELGIINAK